MRKLLKAGVLFVITMSMLFTGLFTSCKNDSEGKFADNICFRKGYSSEGEIVFTGKNFESVEKGFTERYLYYVEFTLNEGGKDILQKCKDVIWGENKVSLWIGDEMMLWDTATVYEDDDKFIIYYLKDEEAEYVYNRMHNLPTTTDTRFPIDRVTLEKILLTVENTFLYNYFEDEVAAGRVVVVPPPYKNTEKSAITCEQDVIDLAEKEITVDFGEYYLENGAAYDSYNRFWHVSFKNEDNSKHYSVVITSEGITKSIFTEKE